MHRLGDVLDLSDLPLSELSAARLAGELYAVGGAYAPLDTVETARLRARSLRALPPALIAEGRTAAWIWGVRMPAPHVPTMCIEPGGRRHIALSAAVQLRQLVLRPDDVTPVAGRRVTTPLRTVVDVARFSTLDDTAFVRREGALLRELGRIGGLGLDECVAMLARRRNLHGKRRAADRLRAVFSPR